MVERAGRLDGLVNCAGISPAFTRSERPDDATWSQILDVNLSGSFYCCREAGRLMLDSDDGGSIVNISSVHASTGFERIAAYATSKGASRRSRTVVVERAQRGVRVNALAPD